VLEGHMDLLTKTPSHAKREGFFIFDKEVEMIITDHIDTLRPNHNPLKEAS
jgi:hypothetical protein